MRYTLICLLLCGCSGAPSMLDPGKTAKEAVLSRVRSGSLQAGLPEAQIACIVDYWSRNMSDDQFRTADTAMATGGTDPVFLNMAKMAPAACIK